MNNLDSKFKKILLILSTIIGIFFFITIGVLFLHARGMMASNDVPSTTNRTQEQTPPDSEEPKGYELRMNATEYQIDLFEELMQAHDQFEALGTDDALEDYASAIVKNFVVDFFTLSNKESRADVGGVQFFSNDVADHFKNAAMDGFYLHLGRLTETFGSEAMPTIESITITEVEFSTRPIDVEADDEEPDEEIDTWNVAELEEPLEPEYEDIIIVYVEWTFAQTALSQIDEFQTSARFVLKEVEDEGVHIFQIEMIEEECEYDMWGHCIEPDDSTYGTTEPSTYPPVGE